MSTMRVGMRWSPTKTASGSMRVTVEHVRPCIEFNRNPP